MSIAGKHVVVTGGGSGVGAEIARAFADAGAHVTIMGRRAQPLEALASQNNISWAVCDVTKTEAVETAFTYAKNQNGPVDIVIANAGDAVSKPFTVMNACDLAQMLDVNIAGVFNVWKAVLADMKAAGWGRMIVVASTAGLKGYPYVSGYCAAKHGAVGLTRALAVELARTGITVNAICPGYVETPLLDRSIAKIVKKTGLSERDAAATLRVNNPQGRFIQAREVAETALWLCSDGASSVNGHALSMSGGEI